jgi:hypothetical protein
MRKLEDVIRDLQGVVKRAAAESKCYGYFATLYLEMTKAVQQGIIEGKFEDNARMEQLDVLFADRYINALQAWKAEKPCSLCWKIAFDETAKNSISTIQHVLLGINAHINLDLGIAAAETMKGAEIEDLKNDFETINAVISELTGKFQEKLNAISWPLRLLDNLGGSSDETIANFSILEARKGAWKSAVELSNLEGNDLQSYIEKRDVNIAQLAQKIAKPNWVANLILKPVKWFEPSRVSEILLRLGAA